MAENIPSFPELRPSRLTFGVEMEFVMPWLYEGEHDPLAHIKDLPPVFRMDKPPNPLSHFPEEIIYKAIKDLFGKHKLPTEVKTYKYKSKFAKKMLRKYDHWEVEDDASVFEPTDTPAFDWIDDFQWVGVEIQSPVEPDIPMAYEILNYARQLLISTYRCRVNHSCGLHVHVGNGSERFSLESMRRIASLVFATEHLLTTLNHPWRTANLYSRALRDRSNLSHKLAGNEMSWGPGHNCEHRPEDCLRYYATDFRYGERPISWRERHRGPKYVDAFEQVRRSGFEPFQPDPGDITTSSSGSELSSFSGTQSNKSTRGNEEDAKFEEGSRSGSGSSSRSKGEEEERFEEEAPSSTSSPGSSEREGSEEENPREGTPNGWQEYDPFNYSNKLFSTRIIPRIKLPRYTTEQLIEFRDKLEEFGVEGLVFEGEKAHRSPDPGVLAAAVEIYRAPSSCAIAHLMYPGGAGRVNFQNYACDSFDHMDMGRTVEFRGAEGSLGPWVVTWAKICVGLVRFAVGSPAHEFIRVLENCQRAEEEDGVYDCIDLLNDLGLFAEALVASRRVAENKDEWGIEYVPSRKRSRSRSRSRSQSQDRSQKRRRSS
ncbi:putative amidoligase enzyme-domain-containing protein [Daldinia bambusicola]|nr:putative amidoligase enzyme-domain-containing protein [Daldinia bambusicola]